MDEGKMNFLKSVLAYSTRNTSEAPRDTNEDTNNDHHPVREMSPEKRKFLEEFLSERTITPIEEMKKCMKCLQDKNETYERRLEALETLRDWCEDINFAMDFHKLDGYKMLTDLLSDSSEEFRALSCDFIATLSQNNEYCQKTLLETTNVFQLLFDKLENDIDSVKIKALYALSCLIREFHVGEQKLIESKGVEKLVKILQIPNEKIQTKCCFLISSVCKNEAVQHEFTKHLVIEKLVNMYQFTEFNIKEYVLMAIISLIDNNPEAINQAKHMNLDFKNIIAQRMEVIGDDPRYKEEKDNATLILDSLFKN